MLQKNAGTPGPIKVHEFGLNQAPNDRRAVMALLKTFVFIRFAV
jgi:hypothetical protein